MCQRPLCVKTFACKVNASMRKGVKASLCKRSLCASKLLCVKAARCVKAALSIHPPTHPSIHPSIYLPPYLAIYLSLERSAFKPVCLILSLFLSDHHALRPYKVLLRTIGRLNMWDHLVLEFRGLDIPGNSPPTPNHQSQYSLWSFYVANWKSIITR